MRPALRALVQTALLSLIAGCATYPENAPREAGMEQVGYRYDVVDAATDSQRNDPKTLVLLALSGGGTRAAAMAYGVLEQLRATCITLPRRPRSRLLDEVDVISSNSGGSYAAAYYGLFRENSFDPAQPQPVIDCELDEAANPGVDPAAPPFTEAFLNQTIESRFLQSLLNPYNVVRLVSPQYNRTDLTAEILSETVFASDGTPHVFGEMVPLGKPFIVLNAQDDARGNRFQFTQEYFDFICSDIATFPVGRAVMASSAVHGAFRAVRLINYPKDDCVEPAWVTNALSLDQHPRALEANPKRYQDARMVRIYRDKECWTEPPDGCAAKANEPHFLRLNDGGTVDNLGIRALVDGLQSNVHDPNLLGRIQIGEVQRVLLISVNAAGEPENDMERRQSDVGVFELISSAVNAAIDTTTGDSQDMVKTLLQRRRQDFGAPPYYDPVLISFEHLPDRVQGRCLKNVPTRLQLSPGQVNAVRQAGAELLIQSSAFQAFMAAYDGVAPPLPDLLDGQDFCAASGFTAS
jgi:NTE family protein